MGVFLFLASLLAAGTVIYLVWHAPVTSSIGGIVFSPRLIICKLLIPADIILSLSMVVVPMVAGVAGGLMAFVAGGFAAAGLSAGVFLVRKFLVPHWTKQFQSESAGAKRVINIGCHQESSSTPA